MPFFKAYQVYYSISISYKYLSFKCPKNMRSLLIKIENAMSNSYMKLIDLWRHHGR